MPPEWHNLFLVVPNISVASILACRLFRELKLGLLEDPMPELTVSKIVFRDIGTISQQESGDEFEYTVNEDGMYIGGGAKLVAYDIEDPALKDIAFEDRERRTLYSERPYS
jgi:hypothetical protein